MALTCVVRGAAGGKPMSIDAEEAAIRTVIVGALMGHSEANERGFDALVAMRRQRRSWRPSKSADMRSSGFHARWPPASPILSSQWTSPTCARTACGRPPHIGVVTRDMRHWCERGAVTAARSMRKIRRFIVAYIVLQKSDAYGPRIRPREYPRTRPDRPGGRASGGRLRQDFFPRRRAARAATGSSPG
jgi:hypothetical protein